MFIPRDEEFISWQGTMWLIVCGYVLENIRNWFVYFVCYLELVEGLTFPNWQYLGHGWVLFSSHFHSVKFHLFVRRFQCLSKIDLPFLLQFINVWMLTLFRNTQCVRVVVNGCHMVRHDYSWANQIDDRSYEGVLSRIFFLFFLACIIVK